MASICNKCGCEIKGDSPICMYCGAAIPEKDISQETKNRLKTTEKDNYRSPNASSTKAIGAVLMILGILADVISMFLIFNSSYSFFSVITIAGTVCFILGIFLFLNG